MIAASEIEETLISLGLARTQEDVDAVIRELDQDGNGELDFNEFLEMLKDTSLRNKKGNFLCDRNLLFQKPAEKKKLPDLGSLHAGEEFKEYRFSRDLRNGHDKNLDMKEKDPKIQEHRKKVRKDAERKRKQLFAKDDSAWAGDGLATESTSLYPGSLDVTSESV